MPFQKGVSGNPNGRPKKERTLTTILERAGNTKHGTVAAKKIMADLLWEAAATGKVTEADGATTPVAMDDRIGIIKFLYQQIDGPPNTKTEHSGAIDLNVVKGYVQVNPDDWDAD